MLLTKSTMANAPAGDIYLIRLVLVFLCFLLFVRCAADRSSPRLEILFDEDWLFHRGSLKGADKVDFDDSSWRFVDLPHDWSIEDLPGSNSPLDSTAIGGVNTGFFVGGTGWYRKHFAIPAGQRDRRFYLQFDGVYMNADIWLNGSHLGNHPYGYTSFGFDITELLLFGEKNVLAVEVKNEGVNSRWYSGSGIYRHVWLKVIRPVHITNRGICITTPEVDKSASSVRITTEIANETTSVTELILVTDIIGPDGEKKQTVVSDTTIEANSTLILDRTTVVSPAELWSVENPALYKAISQIFVGSACEDRTETSFGIRAISCDVEKGFQLNGQILLLKGGNMHHANGPLGARAYDRAEERRVELMKASGFNSIRCAHNPPSPAFLDACDRIGMLVIDEAFDMWAVQKNPQDYHLYYEEWWKKDIESMVYRDRNHPSIIMWSIGNEIPERAKPEGIKRSREMADYVRKLDSTRPVTAAVNDLKPDKDPYFATLDVSGYNYAVGGDHWQSNLYATEHRRVPDRIMFGAESYPLKACGAWLAVLDYPYVIGDYVWTGFDYLGEASIGWLGYWQSRTFYPWNHAFCGDIDICGFKRPQSYYRDILWKNGTQPHIFVKNPKPSYEENPRKEKWSIWHWHDVKASWNWDGFEDKSLEVRVYNASERVELFLNDRSLGEMETNRNNEWTARWTVPYRPGTLRAVSYEGSDQVDENELKTASSPEKIRLTADRQRLAANGQDLSYVVVELLDAQHTRNPNAQNLVQFEIEGPGSIIGVGSSNPRSRESYQQPRRRAFEGRCLVIVKAEKRSGIIRLRAISEGLPSAQIEIKVEKDRKR